MSMPIFTAAKLAFDVALALWFSVRLSVQCGPRRCALAGIGGILKICGYCETEVCDENRANVRQFFDARRAWGAPTNQIEAILGKVRFERSALPAASKCQHDDDIVSCLRLDNNAFRSARSLPSLIYTAVHDALIPAPSPTYRLRSFDIASCRGNPSSGKYHARDQLHILTFSVTIKS
jgi:hypothetical protein